jgi:purine catabolism regulator
MRQCFRKPNICELLGLDTNPACGQISAANAIGVVRQAHLRVPLCTVVHILMTDRWLRVRDILETPHLELDLLAGTEGLARRVTWTHISELERPGEWLEGGELLLVVGMGVPKNADRQVAYIRTLAEADAAGLAVGPRVALRGRALDEANRLRFPVLSIPPHIAYQTIARFVADANGDAAQRRLVTHVRILDTLRLHSEEPGSIAALFGTLEDVSGYRLSVVSPTGRPLIEPSAPIPEKLVSRLPRDASQVALENGWIVPLPGSGGLPALLVAISSNGSEGAGLSAVRHVATVVALELAERHRDRERLRRAGGELLGALLSGAITPLDAGAQLRSHGLRAEGPFQVVVGTAPMTRDLDDALHHRLVDGGVAHLMLRRTDLLLLCNEVGAIDDIATGLSVTLGASDPLQDVSGLAVAQHQARWAAERGLHARRSGLWQFEGDESSFWLPADISRLEDLVRRVLGPLIEYDDEHQSELVRSLTTYLAHGRRLSAAAAELHIHKHTLAYRLKRVAQLTGRDLDVVGDVSQLWLATRALAVLGHEASRA